MPPTNLFNPQAFFEKTAHYASQGRGLFRLTRLPFCLDIYDRDSPAFNNGFINQDKIRSAFSLLKNGIVASSFSLPSFSLGTFDPFSYTGPTKKMAYGQMFNDIDVTFLLMGKTPVEARSLYYFFIKWHEAIGGPRHTSRDASQTNNQELVNYNYKVISDNTMFVTEYYDNYICDALLSVYSPNVLDPDASFMSALEPKEMIGLYLTEVYPSTILQSAVSWESQDAPIQLSLTFSFHYAHINNS